MCGEQTEPGNMPAGSQRRGQAKGDLEGVIFDLDGVLVSTDRFHYLAWKELADRLGLDFDENINHQLRGVSRMESLLVIYKHNPDVRLPSDEELQAQCAAKNARYVELLQDMSAADLLPGAVELLRSLRAAGIRCGTASASRNAALVLDRCGLSEHLDAQADGRHIQHGKPDPEVFLVAAQRLRILPWNCVGVEDADSGIEAIRRADMAAVAIGAHTRGGDCRVDGVADLTVAMLKAVHQRRR
jgi:beta-phosphoglucomutase